MNISAMTREENHRLAVPQDLLRAAINGCADATGRVAAQIAADVRMKDFVLLSLEGVVDDYDGFRNGSTRLAETLGPLMVQNEAGDTVVEVFDRNVGRIEEGVRYHQTRQGGDIHTDSVNRPEPMQLLILACASPAAIGGESIVIRAGAIVKRLGEIPGVVETLSQPFWFEGRGMAFEPNLFQMPVLSQTRGAPSFRYLRPYIESAHERAGDPLTPRQVFAFDVLDAHLELSDLQYRLTLRQGDLLIADDTRVFHGRTSFIDGIGPGAWTAGRCMLRYWIAPQ